MGSAGWTLPGYDIEELVGFGGTGEVWRARDETTGRVVALKRLRAAGGVAERDRLRREAALLAGVVSPHLVRLRSAVSTADGVVLVLDYAAGGSLSALLAARCRLLAGEVVTVADGIGMALRDVHAVGMVHGDITPSNVLFSYDARPLLSDLGLARLAGASPVSGGTPGFADPLVLAGAEPTPGSDVYGLAATCYAALTGSPPVVGETADEVLTMWESGRLPVRSPARPSIPTPLLEAIESALTAAPDERPDVATFTATLRAASRPLRIRLAGASNVVANAPTEVDERSHHVAGSVDEPPEVVASAPRGRASPHATSARPSRTGYGMAPMRKGASGRAAGMVADRLAAVARSAGARQSAGRSADASAANHPSDVGDGRVRRASAALASRINATSRRGRRAALVATATVLTAASLLLCVGAGVRWASAVRQHARPISAGPSRGATTPGATVASHAGMSATTAGGRSPETGAPKGVSIARSTCVRGKGGVVPLGSSVTGSSRPGATESSRRVEASLPDHGAALTAVVSALDALRDGAFVDADPSRLSCAYAPDSAAYRADLRKLRALMAVGERAAGLSLAVTRADVVARHGRFVEVAVRDELPAYRIVDLAGHAIVTRAGRGQQSWRVVLRRDALGWRITTVTPAAQP